MVNLNLRDPNSWWYQESKLPKAPSYPFIFLGGAIYNYLIGEKFWAAVILPIAIGGFFYNKIKEPKPGLLNKRDYATIFCFLYFMAFIAYKTFELIGKEGM